MVIDIAETIRSIPGRWPKLCDTCKSSTAAIFCRHDSAFLCLGCDTAIHSLNKVGSGSHHHARVLICEVCEQAAAAVTCKADAASLCVTCDSDIHSANPLASRHERVPIQPFFGSTEPVKSSSPLDFLIDNVFGLEASDLLIPKFVENIAPVYAKPLDFGFMDIGGFDFQNPVQFGMDSVVPVQSKPEPVQVFPTEPCFDIDFSKSRVSQFSYQTQTQTQSISQSLSSSSLDVGIVPEMNSMSDISYPFGINLTPTEPNLNSAAAIVTGTQLCPTDRKARVLRYREKRKNRKFEKTIRYASRKAYAESRPRIKGRFAKRTESEIGTEMIDGGGYGSSIFFSNAQYGVVPTF